MALTNEQIEQAAKWMHPEIADSLRELVHLRGEVEGYKSVAMEASAALACAKDALRDLGHYIK